LVAVLAGVMAFAVFLVLDLCGIELEPSSFLFKLVLALVSLAGTAIAGFIIVRRGADS